jgi:amino acid adenylation domain-containing protein
MTLADTIREVVESGPESARATVPAVPDWRGETLWSVFEQVAGRHADRIALTFGDEQWTYAALRTEAVRLAQHLRALGVGPESLVGVYMERSPRAIVALLAILRAGGAYLPLDPAYPSERVTMILEDAQPAVLLTETHLRDRLPETGARFLCLDEPPSFSEGASLGDFDSVSGPDNLAYVIYTSGSTGKPKGVMVTQANVTRLLTATAPWFSFDEHDVWTLFHSLAFDFSVWEIWGCLLFGGRLVIVPFAISRSPEEFRCLLVNERVTVLNQTPSAFYQLMSADLAQPAHELALRVVVFGGEALNFSALRPWFARHGDRRPRLINMYGITETTVHVTYREVTASDAMSGSPSLIGVPIPDMVLYLVAEGGDLAAVGEVGELYVGGAGVARGYLNRPELSAERFVRDSFGPDANGRLYKSGDLARRLADGELEYLGRGDAQVKIQGFRIELGEIEAALVSHPQVKEVRVIAHADNEGTKRLVAYFVPEDGASLAVRELSEFLSGKLPPWMRPSVYLQVPVFPMTANGKVDYAALPKPVAGSIEVGREREPEAQARPGDAGVSLESQVAAVWRTVLRAEYVGLDDNFFDIGGTSLLLVAVHAQLQALLNRKISIVDLFTATTVRSLSQKLGRGAGLGKPVLDQPSLIQRQSQNPSQGSGLGQSLAEKQRAAFARARAMKKASQ